MRPWAGTVDLWNWKTARSEPLGFAGDQVTDAASGRRDDAGTTIEKRNVASGGNDRSGPAFEWDGATQSFTRADGATVTLDPAYFILGTHRLAFAGDAAAGDTRYQRTARPVTATRGRAESDRRSTGRYDAPSRSDSSMPTPPCRATRARRPTIRSAPRQGERARAHPRLRGRAGILPDDAGGSVADLQHASRTSQSISSSPPTRSVSLADDRRLATGNADDVQFTPGERHPFGVALMDGDGRNHIGSRHETLSLAP